MAARPLKKATFAAGCFWAVEDTFMQLPGVVDTVVGFSGGHVENPTSAEVNSETTGHAEGILMTYDESEITYERLLDVFWALHDPTSLNRQGPDEGNQYRSVIFYHDEKQKEAAENSKRLQQDKYTKPIVTEIVPAQTFYAAEERHQKYLLRNGKAVCH